MSVAWYVEFPCPVRELYSSEVLSQMDASRHRAEVVLGIMRNGPQAQSGIPEDDWTFTLNDGSEARTLRVGDLLAESKPLEDVEHHCVSCVASLLKRSFGCGGSIPYPISAAAERWLMSRLPTDMSSAKGKLLIEATKDFANDVRDIDAARQSGTFFEAASPTIRKWRSFLQRKAISSSQIVKLLLFVGTLSANHAWMMAYVLDFLDDDFSPTFEAINQGDDRSTIELHQFLQGCALAGQSNVPLFIDS
jgi:hypothetical protein